MSQSLGDTAPREGASSEPEAALTRVTPASMAKRRPPPAAPEFLNVVIDNMDGAVPRYGSRELHTYLHPRCKITGDHDHAYINTKYRFSEEGESEDQAGAS